jgi:TonB-linked SusC/RagA family outer membrane protein
MKYLKIGIAYCLLFAFMAGTLQAQNASEVKIKAAVYDENGQPVSGVSISVNQGKKMTYTDADGKFSISATSASPILITAPGFKTQSFPADAVPERIVLAQDAGSMPVNMPFKRINREDVHGAVTVLNPESYLDYDYNQSVEGGLNGRTGGLLWSNNIWGMENAIVMIDGIRREFTDIVLAEVQQINILKGVNAVALYGSQGAKGVILITSKKGEANIRKINVRVNKGVSRPLDLPEYLNSGDYMGLFNEARRNDGLPELYDAATIQNYRTGNTYRYPSVDYYSSQYLKKYLNTIDANAEFSGGNSTARFYSNVGWSNSTTLLNVGEGKNEGDNRFNIRGNIDLKLNDFITSSVYVSAIFNDSRRGRGNYWGNAALLVPNRFSPLIPIDLINPADKPSQALVKGSRNLLEGKYLLGGTQQFTTNPLADLYVGGYDKNIRRTFQVTNGIDVDLRSVTQGLSLHTLFNLDYSNSYLQSITNNYAVYNPTWRPAADSIASLQKFKEDSRPGTQNINNTTQRQNIGFSSWLSYEKSVKDKHNISAMLLGYASAIKVNDIYQPITNSHFAMQLGYNYKHRYWVDFTGAYVNSTRLPDGNRGGFSPTMSLGWLLTAENFMANAKAVDYLKLSASAGILNTDLDISGYYLYDNIYTSQAFFTWNDGVAAQNRATLSSYGASPGLSFPKRREFNASLEGLFFKKLISLQGTFFISDMDGLVTQRFSQYPSYFSSFIPYTNYNSNRRTGFDFMLSVNKKVGQVALSLGFNGTYSNSKVIKRDELYIDAYQNRVGKPVDAIFGLVSKGFFNDQNDINNSPRQVFSEVRPGDIKYQDQNGDGVIDLRDEIMIGRWIAPFSYGITFTAGLRNFNLFVLGTGSNGGNGMKNNDYYWVDGDNKYSEVVWDRWTEATKATAKFPRLSSSQNNNDFRNSDFWLFSSNRFNLSKVQLTYNFSSQVIHKTFIRDLGVFVSGSNLYTFSKNRKVLELNVASAPQLRNFNVGLRAKF